MLPILLSALVAVPLPDVAQAQRLYQKARYADALAALGSDCIDTSSPSDCERIRASSHVALGEEALARAAFARLLVHDPRANLADAAPKLQALLQDVKRAYEGLTELSLAPVRRAAPGSPWRLELTPPSGVPIERVAVYLDAARLGFERVPLTARGDSWSADYRAPAGAPIRPAYFVETTIAGGAKVTSGSSAVPRELAVAGDGSGAPEVITAARVPLDRALAAAAPPGALAASVPAPPTLRTGGGMPRWGIWAIAGGAAAVLAGGVSWAIVRSRTSQPGRIVVGIQFEDR